MTSWNWKEFLWKALIRALRTFAQTFAGAITVGMMWSEVQWLHALSVAGVAFVYSVVMSVATGLPEVDKNPPIEPPIEED